MAEGGGRGWAVWAIALLAGVAVVAGLILSGGPMQGRKETRDRVRADDLTRIDGQVNCLAQNGDPAPWELAATPACPDQPRLADPYTGAPYRVERVDDRNIRLCAGFETADWGSRYGYGGAIGPEGADANCRVSMVPWPEGSPPAPQP